MTDLYRTVKMLLGFSKDWCLQLEAVNKVYTRVQWKSKHLCHPVGILMLLICFITLFYKYRTLCNCLGHGIFRHPTPAVC
jgi:hypothetical protein